MEELSDQTKIHLLREMIRARRFESTALSNYCKEKMGGWLILQVGQEAIPVAARSLLGKNDHTICGHRCLGHALASGMTMNEAMAELYGKTTGCSGGHGGMLGFFAPHRNFHGGYSVAGAQTPIAAGLAFALKQQKISGAVLCFLGDGAMNQGSVHESFNLASLFHLPVVYIIENNRYSMGTSVPRSSNFQEPLAKRAEAYNMDWDFLEDGSNLIKIRSVLRKAITRAKEELLPTLVEIQTYRFYGFTVADGNARKYRTPEEIEYHMENFDPIRNWQTTLVEEGTLDESQIKEINREARQEVKAASDFADQSPPPTTEDLTKNVYWEIDHNRPTSGRHFFHD